MQAPGRLHGGHLKLRHHSEESLSGHGIHGLTASSLRTEAGYSTRVHSSADDLSSAYRSERSDSADDDGDVDDDDDDGLPTSLLRTTTWIRLENEIDTLAVPLNDT